MTKRFGSLTAVDAVNLAVVVTAIVLRRSRVQVTPGQQRPEAWTPPSACANRQR